MSCNMCGQCCRKIHLWEPPDRFKNKDSIGDFGFIRDNFEYIGTSREVGGFVVKDSYGREEELFVYKCKRLTDDNKCSIHDDKPIICSGYPWYGEGVQPYRSQPWPYVGCGYERIHYEMRLIRSLKHRVDQLSEKKSITGEMRCK